MENYPNLSLLSYTQPFELKCGVSEDGMSMILCTMSSYEFSIVPCYETADTALSMSSNGEKRTHSLWDQFNGSFTHEAMELKVIDGRHLEMGNIFPFQDNSFSMRISHLKEKLILAAYP